MQINIHDDTPIFMQVARAIEEAIFIGAFLEETQIPSTTEISMQYKINPATVLKGMNILVDKDILYKKRGLGMFVKAEAVQKIQMERQTQFYEKYIINMAQEAAKLSITKDALMEMIERGIAHAQN